MSKRANRKPKPSSSEYDQAVFLLSMLIQRGLHVAIAQDEKIRIAGEGVDRLSDEETSSIVKQKPMLLRVLKDLYVGADTL